MQKNKNESQNAAAASRERLLRLACRTSSSSPPLLTNFTELSAARLGVHLLVYLVHAVAAQRALPHPVLRRMSIGCYRRRRRLGRALALLLLTHDGRIAVPLQGLHGGLRLLRPRRLGGHKRHRGRARVRGNRTRSFSLLETAAAERGWVLALLAVVARKGEQRGGRSGSKACELALKALQHFVQEPLLVRELRRCNTSRMQLRVQRAQLAQDSGDGGSLARRHCRGRRRCPGTVCRGENDGGRPSRPSAAGRQEVGVDEQSSGTLVSSTSVAGILERIVWKYGVKQRVNQPVDAFANERAPASRTGA